MSLIGRVIATEKVPTTIDEFHFWTDTDLILNPFDVVVVDHIANTKTFGVIEEISHITDSASFLSNFISNDFGDYNVEESTIRIGMNYVKAKVVGNSGNIFIPVKSNSKVSLASKEEVVEALGLDNIKNELVCGYLEMYEKTKDHEKIMLPVPIDSRFLIGPEGAHLNISGISGLAAKTSYAMFLLKSIQERCMKVEDTDDVAFVVFNVKGKDLLALDEPNDFEGNIQEEKRVKDIYDMLGIEPSPFKNVKYLYPYSRHSKPVSYVPLEVYESQLNRENAFQYKFTYSEDKENLDLLFANIDDTTQTMESIISKIIDGDDGFGYIDTWPNFVDLVGEKCEAGSKGSKEISVMSWRKFSRVVKKSIYKKDIFEDIEKGTNQVRIKEKIQELRSNDVYVIDIANLDTDMQAFVFGHTMRELYNYQLDPKVDEEKNYPSKVVVFIDELNKFASTDSPKNSPILKQILDIAERGRSLGIILFGAEQFKSAIHSRVTGNSSTYAYGRTNSIEVGKPDYKYIPSVYKGMMTRLNQGEYIIQNPIFRSLLNVKFPKPLYRQFK